MKSRRLTTRFIAFVLLSILHGGANAQQIYKWTDANGQVHYGQNKPDDVAPTQTLNIAPTPPAPATTSTDANAEIARINALADKMARERQAMEQARQDQAIRNLEQENQQLKNDLLNQQLQQKKPNDDSDSDNNVIIRYPSYYPYPPYLYPPKPPYPPHPGPPCQPWPTCRHPMPPAALPPPKPLAKPNPPFKPAPVGIAPESQGVFRGR